MISMTSNVIVICPGACKSDYSLLPKRIAIETGLGIGCYGSSCNECIA